ncbi:unnamed protein product, partial [Ectocarpus sp. 6 AP-2014]
VVSEIEARHATLQSTEEGRETQEFLLHGREAAIETFDGMPTGFKYLSETDRAQVAKRMIDQQLKAGEQQLHESRVALKQKRVDDLVHSYRALQDIGVRLDGRTLIELRDSVTILSRQDLVVNDAVAVATRSCGTRPRPRTSLTRRRGAVSSKIGMRVGKLMRQLYIKKYALAGNWNAFVKRQTLFNGRHVMENCFFSRDEDIIEQAIREVMHNRGQ